MEELVQHFEKISAIIQSNRNCLHHKGALVRLIDNFYNFHIKDSEIDKFKETGLLTYMLHKRLNKVYENTLVNTNGME
jgi:hypothetical protein